MITLKARFDGRVFIPQEPVDLPVNCELEIAFARPLSVESTSTSTLLRLAEIANEFPVNLDLPTDLAVQHDHYLYDTPKLP